MLTRSGFKRPQVERQRTVHTPIPAHLRRNAAMARADIGNPITDPKTEAIQHAGYMNAVRSLPCARCGAAPRSQFCHSDEGKGTGIKSDCRLGWPGCAQCHHDIGTRRIYPKEQRRALEAEFARQTRAQIESMGLWPKNLPRWTS
jgi:hypothetical protein